MPTFLLVALGLMAVAATAHDIPTDATVRLILKPAGTKLHLLARIPLRTVRDIPFPERADGYLDAERLAPQLPDAVKLWIAQPLKVEADGRLLGMPRIAGVRLSLPSDRSFESFQTAYAHVTGPGLASGERVVWSQVFLDAALEYEIPSERAELAIQPAFTHLAARVVTALVWEPVGGAARAFEFTGDPGLTKLDPSWTQAAGRFVQLGFAHILEGVDHLLFLVCLVAGCRRVRALLGVVTAFALAHSVTLVASAMGWAPGALWFPPLVELMIAVSIVWMALENVLRAGAGEAERWRLAFLFGLVHGFGFSFALRESLQFAGDHLLAALLCFNLGVELGQVLVVLVFAPVLTLALRRLPERGTLIVLSAVAAHTGWHWMTERWELLRKYSFEWPEANAATLASALRWLMVVVLLVGLDRVVSERRRRYAQD